MVLIKIQKANLFRRPELSFKILPFLFVIRRDEALGQFADYQLEKVGKFVFVVLEIIRNCRVVAKVDVKFQPLHFGLSSVLSEETFSRFVLLQLLYYFNDDRGHLNLTPLNLDCAQF